MADLPSFAMRVSDSSSSSAFLAEKLGFTLIVGHTGEHLDEIWEIRRKYGK